MPLPCLIPLAFGLLGQVLPAPPFPESSAARLDYMKGTVAPYVVRRATTPAGPPFRLQPDPAFRLDNPLTAVKDGAIFLWTDAETGRPEASAQVFRISNGFWLHEWSSLATGPIVAEVGTDARWHPDQPGVTFRPIPDAPAPAATPEARLRQMRALAADFSARDDFEGKRWTDLRLLPKPLVRYGKAGSGVEDGALFALVLGTDPEVFLQVESRPGPSGAPARWHYAFSPMTSYAVQGSWKGKEVWSLPWRKESNNASGPFFDMEYSREAPAQ